MVARELQLYRLSQAQPWRILLLIVGLSASLHTRADPLSAVQVLREGGCGGTLPAARPLNHNASLDRAAQQWAVGASIGAAAERSGYQAETTAGLHISGPESSTIQLLRQRGCRTVTDQSLHDIGVYQRGLDTWLVLATAFVVPARSQAPALASRALQLVNEVRAHGARCGGRTFGPAPPVRLSGILANVAYGHANDMAEHNYFEHQDRAGRSPADRVRAVGYPEKLVGENIAYGPKSAEEVVQGWLDSPGHCENIMDPRFAEMGIAYAAGQASKRGLYWVQLLADPRV
ncbi:MAG: CAP domain-containing protein [Steroidobacteraceae bacterium]